jgi:rod shape-determining protein MreD
VRNAALIALGFGLLVFQTAAATVISVHPLAPNLLLPMVIYLGVSHDVHIVRGAVISFVLGYLLDSFCGSPMGLQTFVLVAVFMVARGAGLRLFLRGPAFQMLLTFFTGVLAGGTILALRAIFERPAPFPAGGAWDTVLTLVIPSIVTAVASPLVFMAVRKVDTLVVKRREDGGAGTAPT